IRVLAGRDFDAADAAGEGRVCIVNRAFAETYFGGVDGVVGRSLPELGPKSGPSEIVGVVADIRQRGLREAQGPTVYEPLGRQYFGRMTLVARSALGEGPAGEAVAGAVAALDRGLPVFDAGTLEERLAAAAGRERLMAALLTTFGAAALLLAGTGLYGVLSYAIASRAREIGVRMALGADARRIRRLVIGQGARVAATGCALGLAAAVGARRAMAGFVYGVDASDPAALVTAVAVIGVAALLASALPAWRAARVDPAAALRDE
ncbi:MAG TPA: FtsX-like permease family protein, partial [Vicinamibacteria bacterium]|nr:FtsX-like permease family protein [Vicinamibacteria bacterium]